MDNTANSRNKTELIEMSEKHDVLRKKVDFFSTQNEVYQRDNFGKLYYEIDAFFTDLTRIAVRKNFFPNAVRERTIKDTINSLRQV